LIKTNEFSCTATCLIQFFWRRSNTTKKIKISKGLNPWLNIQKSKLVCDELRALANFGDTNKHFSKGFFFLLQTMTEFTLSHHLKNFITFWWKQMNNFNCIWFSFTKCDRQKIRHKLWRIVVIIDNEKLSLTTLIVWHNYSFFICDWCIVSHKLYRIISISNNKKIIIFVLILHYLRWTYYLVTNLFPYKLSSKSFYLFISDSSIPTPH